MTGMRITCILRENAVLHFHGLHLDGILAYAVVEQQTAGAMLPQSPDYIPIELPLKRLWQSEGGVPLWASTDLLPVDTEARDTVWLHRRALESTMTRANLHTGKGRYKERRSPLPSLVTNRLVAYADGDLKEVAALLARVTSIGKKRAVTGAVQEWLIEEWPFSLTDEAGRARRPIPHLYLYGEERDNGTLLAYSPPYWHVTTRAVCIPTGNPC